MSVGNSPRRRRPSLNENFGFAVCSLPIHFGGSDVFLVRKTWTMAARSRTRTRMLTTLFEPPLRGAPLLAREEIETMRVMERAAPPRDAAVFRCHFSLVARKMALRI